MSTADREVARDPQDLARLFIARANDGDLEGLVALYEHDAVLAAGEIVATGHAEIRKFYANLLERRKSFPAPEQLPALRNDATAMTFARLPNGTISAEVARRQESGEWLWAIDQLKIKPQS